MSLPFSPSCSPRWLCPLYLPIPLGSSALYAFLCPWALPFMPSCASQQLCADVLCVWWILAVLCKLPTPLLVPGSLSQGQFWPWASLHLTYLPGDTDRNAGETRKGQGQMTPGRRRPLLVQPRPFAGSTGQHPRGSPAIYTHRNGVGVPLQLPPEEQRE